MYLHSSLQCAILLGTEVSMNKTFGISLSEQDIVEIDEAAWRVRKNRSEFVREVVSEYIHKVKTENPQETAVTA